MSFNQYRIQTLKKKCGCSIINIETVIGHSFHLQSRECSDFDNIFNVCNNEYKWPKNGSNNKC